MKVSLGLNSFVVKNIPQTQAKPAVSAPIKSQQADSVSFGFLRYTKARAEALTPRYANWLSNLLWDNDCNDAESISKYMDDNFKNVLEGYPVGVFKYVDAADIEVIYEGIKHLKKSGKKGEMVYEAFVNRLKKNDDEFDQYGRFFSPEDHFPLNRLADALKKYKLKTVCGDDFIKKYDKRKDEPINITGYMGPS